MKNFILLFYSLTLLTGLNSQAESFSKSSEDKVINQILFDRFQTKSGVISFEGILADPSTGEVRTDRTCKVEIKIGDTSSITMTVPMKEGPAIQVTVKSTQEEYGDENTTNSNTPSIYIHKDDKIEIRNQLVTVQKGLFLKDVFVTNSSITIGEFSNKLMITAALEIRNVEILGEIQNYEAICIDLSPSN